MCAVVFRPTSSPRSSWLRSFNNVSAEFEVDEMDVWDFLCLFGEVLASGDVNDMREGDGKIDDVSFLFF